jgi:hypothetical protein
MEDLRQSTSCVVIVGPFIAVADGFTPLTALSSRTGELFTNGTGTAFTPTSWTHIYGGYYAVGLSASHIAAIGRMRLAWNDPATFGPVWEKYRVLSAAVYDWFFGATGAVILPTSAPTGYGGPSIVPASGAVAASPAPTAMAFTLAVSGLTGTPGSGAWVGQVAYREATGERRIIVTHTVSGSNHALTFGSGSGLNGPFATAPSAGETIDVA